ncbi:transcriptional activator of glycolytic enzymes-domain-containing protein [Corynascus novoguineensis]|uniref:Transcriptional activator of glycolytic enzymes-domain-containing protein n=1 Tax=Corynascus novoguineensis TaxID=1126955 RepID=A0AAN7HI35_9PEZI|nr:transcriptional activator of glycolytic enzymes-domain-containing protein [Corynascus novoguineensis]
MRHILREAASQSRKEWADRILNTIKDGYSPAKIPEHTAAAWRFSDVNSGFRTNVDFLFGNHMLLRSSNRLALELADCFCLDLPKEGVKSTSAGASPTKALVVIMNQGKTNQHGRVEYGSCLRHRDPEACLVGQLAFWLFFRWQVEKKAAEPFPDFSRPERWYQIKVLRRSKADYKAQLSYATAHKWALDFYSLCGIKTSKATHAPRVAAAQNADMAGVSDAQMTGCYITTLPFEFMRATADFEPAWAGSYHIPRATVQPEPWLRSQIWPQLDHWLDFEADDKATGAFIELLHWLRDVLLQDAVFLMAKYPGHPVFQDPVFWSPQFNAFGTKVRDAAQESFEEDRGTAIEKVIPEVSEKLRSLTAYQLTIEKAVERRHFELVQEVKQLKAQIADMCRMEYQVVTTFTPGGRLHRTEQFARRQGHNPALSPPTQPLQPPPELPRQGAPAMAVSQQGPPQIKFPRTLRSVADLYQLWRYGFGMMPSIDELEKRWGSRWRLRNERQLFSIRKVVIDEVVKVASARGWPEEDAVKELERQRVERGNLSLDAFAKQLKAARKT